MAKVKVYSTATCPICDKAKQCLTKWNIDHEVLMIDESQEALKEMQRISNNARSVPQIVIEDKWIGGFAELTELHMDGGLDHLGTRH